MHSDRRRSLHRRKIGERRAISIARNISSAAAGATSDFSASASTVATNGDLASRSAINIRVSCVCLCAAAIDWSI
jgi:hypothetical protein